MLRVTEQRAGDAESLAHAEGEVADLLIGDRRDARELEHLVDSRLRGIRFDAASARR
jgi:predicted nucleic acid-binding protein